MGYLYLRQKRQRTAKKKATTRKTQPTNKLSRPGDKRASAGSDDVAALNDDVRAQFSSTSLVSLRWSPRKRGPAAHAVLARWLDRRQRRRKAPINKTEHTLK